MNGGAPAPEDAAFKDLMNLCWTDGKQSSDVQQMGRYLTGLLEVEPLHFTCHATSDGTRMERVDSGDEITSSYEAISWLRLFSFCISVISEVEFRCSFMTNCNNICLNVACHSVVRFIDCLCNCVYIEKRLRPLGFRDGGCFRVCFENVVRSSAAY
jgi:hypothetical protein